jgi:hypothetical protein
MNLFKVVTIRDEVVIGVPAEAASEPIHGIPLDTLAARLFAAGHVVVWQYAAQRGQDGVIRQAPLRRIALAAAGVLRIEPFVSEQEVVAPD